MGLKYLSLHRFAIARIMSTPIRSKIIMPTEIYTLRNWVYKIKVYMNSVYSNNFYQI